MPATPKLMIAVVDDDAPTLALICSMLESLGHQGTPFESAAALAAARRKQTFHALVLDLCMPDVDGFELIYQLAEQQPVEPVIVSSSLPNDILQAARLVSESLGITVLGVLPKPFASDELCFLLAPHAQALASRQG